MGRTDVRHLGVRGRREPCLGLSIRRATLLSRVAPTVQGLQHLKSTVLERFTGFRSLGFGVELNEWGHIPPAEHACLAKLIEATLNMIHLPADRRRLIYSSIFKQDITYHIIDACVCICI